jgi:proline dehydrogenase
MALRMARPTMLRTVSVAWPLQSVKMSATPDVVREKSSVSFHQSQVDYQPHCDTIKTEEVIPDFDDSQATFESKSTKALLRATLVYTLCRIQPIVDNSEPLLKLTRRVLGNKITDAILKATLYGHFCAGEDERRLQPVIEELRRNGIGGILDYAAESDIEPTPQNLQPVPGFIQPARVYDYESEAACDHHVEIFRSCIRSVANVSPDGFAAIKVTALGNPKLLERMSIAITESKNLFAKFDQNGNGFISREEFEKGYRHYFNDADERLPELFEILDPEDTGLVDYITWSKLLTPHDLPLITKSCRETGPLMQATPNEEEVELIEKMHARAHALAEEAFQCGTRLLIDAEHFRFQPAIDNLVLELQQTYNATDKSEIPIIFNTYQCYLKDNMERLVLDVERSERFNYHFACKLVRGAYMESERRRAEKKGYPSPIHDTIEDTHKSYDDAVAYLIQHSVNTDKQVELMCATHNQASIEKAIAVMHECGIDRAAPTLHFAQLYGMSDNLTYNLGKSGFRAYKYVPYGKVSEVMPYLMRRAQENSAMMGNATGELAMLRSELFRRMRKSIGMSS